jgi:quercetin dioxygenase-like cupin family protein
VHAKQKLTLVGLIAAASMSALPNLTFAQQFKRTEVQRHDLTGTNMEIIVAVVEAPPGAILPWHFHYGEEAVYVLEGAMTETLDGRQQMSATGSSYINVREVPHGGYRVIGDKLLKVLTIHIVDKGKLMTWPVTRAPNNPATGRAD